MWLEVLSVTLLVAAVAVGILGVVAELRLPRR